MAMKFLLCGAHKRNVLLPAGAGEGAKWTELRKWTNANALFC